MNRLEDQLTNAAEEARRQVAHVDTRSPATVRARLHRHRAFAGAAVVAGVFGLLGATAVIANNDGTSDFAAAPESTTIAAPVPDTTAASPVSDSEPVDITHLVSSVIASSELSENHAATALIDGDLDGAWNDASLRGAGAELQFTFDTPVTIHHIVIHPLRDEERFLRNYWIQDLELSTDDGENPVEVRFEHGNTPHVIEFGSAGTTVLQLRVLATYPAEPVGDKPPFNELAIAEIQIFGHPVDGPTSATASEGAVTASEALPRLGVTVDDWTVVGAFDGGTDTLLLYDGNPEEYGSLARLAIDVSSDDTADAAADGYRRMLQRLMATEEPLGDVIVTGGVTAEAFTFTDSNSGNSGYFFLWQHSDTITVDVIAYVEQFEQARILVSSIEPFPESTWTEMAEVVITAPTATTTTVVALDKNPPALSGTALTVAWEEWVTKTMRTAGFELEDVYVFEREMDRGLVHATFTTADGNEWAFAFGPWRDGEYETSDDPAELQAMFSDAEPVQETPEGLLLIVPGRLRPHYALLAIDVGKISITVEPLSTSAAVPDKDLLGDLSLAAAPTVRRLLGDGGQG